MDTQNWIFLPDVLIYRGGTDSCGGLFSVAIQCTLLALKYNAKLGWYN
jgi:hypothetical protein